VVYHTTASAPLQTDDIRRIEAAVLVDGTPDPVRFREAMVPLIVQACRGRLAQIVSVDGRATPLH
jgi:hypothetical protein